jgi:hypothetical protein
MCACWNSWSIWLIADHCTQQVRDERGLVGQGGASLSTSNAASVLEGGEELDVFLRAALIAQTDQGGIQGCDAMT